MCDTCGCGQPGENTTITIAGKEQNPLHKHADGTWHSHGHSHEHEHHHHPPHGHTHSHEGRLLSVEEDILTRNNRLAERNRGWFEAREVRAFNLMSSPGSGKTTLLEKTIQALGREQPVYVIEGDQQTMNDARRIDAAGAPVAQVNTGNGCHLDAEMIHHAIKELNIRQKSLVFIENVGNLVCPSLFDLGEHKRIVIISTTEGDDKPVKYPTMFEKADLCLINKTDLLPYVDFDTDKAREYALRVNPGLEFISLSARTGEGMDAWLRWLQEA